MSKYQIFFSVIFLSAMSSMDAVNTFTQLQTALQNNISSISIDANIDFNSLPYPVNSNTNLTPHSLSPIVIEGNGNTLDGNNFRGFVIRGNTAISELVFSNMKAQGGNGGISHQAGTGGGGAGLGGALLVMQGASLNLTDCSFLDVSAQGGAGGVIESNSTFLSGGSGGGVGGAGSSGSAGGGGGGGLFFAGGSSTANGGGGGAGAGQAGTSASGINGSNGGNDLSGTTGGGAGGINASGENGLSGGGGGGGASGQNRLGGNGGLGAGGGGAGYVGSGNGNNGGHGGGFGGGGGGGATADLDKIGGEGGHGELGGGGGGGGAGELGIGGNGGFSTFGGGGGGGGYGQTIGGQGGASVLGGAGGAGGTTGGGTGGGGAALGGAVFMDRGSNVTIQITPNFSGSLFQNTTVTGGVSPAPAGNGTKGSDGQGIGEAIFMYSSSSLTFDLAQDLNLSSAIRGGFGKSPEPGGGLTKKGPAKLTLSNGDHDYTGTTTVQQGTLTIDNGSVSSNVVVETGATLNGNFTVKKSGTSLGHLTNNGYFSPGINGVGTCTIEGNYIQGANGVLSFNLTPLASTNTITIDGIAQLDGNGTLELILGPGNYVAGTQYTLFSAPNQGEFGAINITGPGAGGVDFQVTYGSLILTVLNHSLFQFQNVSPGIPTTVADALMDADISPGTDLANVLAVLGTLSDAAMNTALFDMSPVRLGALEWINTRDTNEAAYVIQNHLFKQNCVSRVCDQSRFNGGVWVDVYGDRTFNRKRNGNLPSFHSSLAGVLAGYDLSFSSPFTFGGAVGYSHNNMHFKNSAEKGDINNYIGSLYASYTRAHLGIDVSAIGGGSRHSLNRRLDFGTIDRTAKSDFWGKFAAAHIGLQTSWGASRWKVEPFVVGNYNYFKRDGFKEKGAESLDLNVKSKDQQFLHGEAGMRLSLNARYHRSCLLPYIGLSWVGDFPLGTSYEKATFVDQTYLMKVKSYHSCENMISPEVGLTLKNCSGVSFAINYRGYFNNRVTENTGEGRFEWTY
jgi:uncharacterized protein with beta-barrel porin domain